MKSLTKLLLGVFVLIISILIILAILGIYTFYSEGAGTGAPKYLEDSFDYTTYILDKDPIDTNTYDECDKLIRALKYVMITGNPYKVDEISYGTDLYSRVLFNGRNFPLIGDCPIYDGEEIKVNIGDGLEQKLCTFKTINTNEVQGRNPFGGISDAANLYFDNCIYIPSDHLVMAGSFGFSGHIGPDESFNPVVDAINTYYSPDYLYMQNGNFEHPPGSLNDPNEFSDAYNGPGRLKIYVGDATSTDGNCNFNIYFCPRTAIGRSIDNSTIDIFNIFRNLELYDLLIEPYYIRDLTHLASSVGSYSKKVYYWNYYEVSLDTSYRVETIINAIKEGLYVNVYGRNYSWAHPHWDIKRDTSSGCWDSDYDDLINSGNSGDKTRSIRFNCGNNNVCSGTLRIKIAMRRDFRDIDGDGNIENHENYVSGFISFCESPECSDGIDNDGDGDCDLPTSICTDGSTPGDSGCTDATDDNEALCGDSYLDSGEECDPPAAVSGQCGGFHCANDCTCNLPPIVLFTASPTTLYTNNFVDFDASASYDPDGSIVSYSWDFGDGNTGTGVTTSHAYSDGGSYIVTLTIRDDDGATNSTSVTITVLNRDPVASFTASDSSVDVTDFVDFDASASYDPDGSIVSYSWDFGDGNTGTGVTTSHSWSSPGCYTVTLTVTDDDGATNSANIVIDVGECPNKCESGSEYRGGTYSGTCTYSTVNDCRYGCKDSMDCWGGKWCPSKGGEPQGCGDTCCWPCIGTECWTTAQCIREDWSAPTCNWIDRYDCAGCYVGFPCGCPGGWSCEGAWPGVCCARTKVCTASCSDSDSCKYV